MKTIEKNFPGLNCSTIIPLMRGQWTEENSVQWTNYDGDIVYLPLAVVEKIWSQKGQKNNYFRVKRDYQWTTSGSQDESGYGMNAED